MYRQHRESTTHADNRSRRLRLAAVMASASLFLITVGSVAHGGEIVRDNFDYTNGEISGLNGGSGSWSGNWFNFGNNNFSEVVTPSTPLTFNNLGGGNALQLTPVNGSVFTPVNRSFSGLAPGQTFFQSYLLRVDSDTWDGNDFFVGYSDQAAGNAGSPHSNSPNLGLRAANDATDNDFVARVDLNADLAIPSVDFEALTTYLLLAKFESTDGDDNYEQASYWINPGAGDEFLPDAIASVGQSSSGLAIDNLGFRFGSNLDSNDILLVDDVRISTDFATAAGVPEPASILIWTIIGSIAALFGWRKMRAKSAVRSAA